MTAESDIQDILKGLFPDLMGLRITKVDPDCIEAELTVRPDLCTGGNILHGGALMALADTLGAVGTLVNLQPGQRTATLESKTNFFGSAPEGSTVVGTSVPLHKGRSTQTWQTTIRSQEGKMLGQVTQTQFVLGG